MDSHNVEICKPLFVRTAADGQVWEFAGTTDGGCAIVCSGQVIATATGASEPVMILLERFFQATAGAGRAALSNSDASIQSPTSSNASAA